MSLGPGSPTLPAVAVLLAVSASIATSAEGRPSRSGGATADDSETQRVELYREASKAAASGHWAEAKERLRAVLAIRSSAKVLFSLAEAEEHLGQLAHAQADYARSLEEAAAEGKTEVVEAAEQAQRALAARVPHVRVVVSGAEPGRPGTSASASGASATLDDQPVPVGTAVALDPGEHRLVVNAPGMRATVRDMKVGEAEQVELSVSLEPDHAARALPPPVSPVPPPVSPVPAPIPSPAAVGAETRANPALPWRVAALTSAATGVVALGLGAAFGVASMRKHSEADNACPGTTCSTAAGASLWHEAVTTGNASTAWFVLGGLGLVGGGILWFCAPRTNGAWFQVGIDPASVHVRGAW
jgi:hypothetical protein